MGGEGVIVRQGKLVRSVGVVVLLAAVILSVYLWMPWPVWFSRTHVVAGDRAVIQRVLDGNALPSSLVIEKVDFPGVSFLLPYPDGPPPVWYVVKLSPGEWASMRPLMKSWRKPSTSIRSNFFYGVLRQGSNAMVERFLALDEEERDPNLPEYYEVSSRARAGGVLWSVFMVDESKQGTPRLYIRTVIPYD